MSSTSDELWDYAEGGWKALKTVKILEFVVVDRDAYAIVLDVKWGVLYLAPIEHLVRRNEFNFVAGE